MKSMNRLGALRVCALAMLVIGLPAAASAQIFEMKNDFLQLFFGPNGSLIVADPNTNTLKGVRYSPTPTAVFDASMEMMAAAPSAAENWVVSLLDPDGLPLFLVDGGLAAGFGDIGAGNGSGNNLVRTFVMELTNEFGGPAILSVRHTVEITQGLGEQDKRVKFTVTMENLTADPLSGISYMRTVNPKQGLFVQGLPQSLKLNFGLAEEAFFPGGMAVVSSIPGVPQGDPRQREFGLGSEIPGARVNSYGNAVGNLEIAAIAANHYLWDGTNRTKIGNGDAFPSEPTPMAMNLWFGEDVIGTILPYSRREIGSFVYIFDGATPEGEIPEPGVVAFLAGGISAFGLVLLRRRRGGA